MRLKQLIKNMKGLEPVSPISDVEIKMVCIDSRQVKPESLFIALKGCNADGKNYIEDAVQKGARVIVLKKGTKIGIFHKNVEFLYVRDTHAFLREVVRKMYGQKSRKVKVIGITGTNGKTTISYLLESLLKYHHQECGVIGTVNHRYAGKIFSAKNTTPGYLENHQMLSAMHEKSVKYCAMEVSSHALDQGRVDDINFRTAIFTNLTNDHMDYHKTFNHYFSSKAKLFMNLKGKAISVVNIDDEYGLKLRNRIKTNVVTYGIKNKSDVMAKDIFLGVDGSSFRILTPKGSIFVKTHLIGIYNVYNILAATAAALNENISLDEVQAVLRNFRAVPGRLEKVKTKTNIPVFIDYAHTPDALLNVLKAIRAITSNTILLVFGCGGDRDKTKRPLMGSIASDYADLSIVTSDNPRGEKPKEIINQILKGFKNNKYLVIEKREQAICRALKIAKPNDIVLIAGKGHEDYQIFKDKVISFNEKKIIKSCFHA